MDLDIVELSRLQFALTAMYHFLFVPLTLGLSVIVAIMETDPVKNVLNITPRLATTTICNQIVVNAFTKFKKKE